MADVFAGHPCIFPSNPLVLVAISSSPLSSSTSSSRLGRLGDTGRGFGWALPSFCPITSPRDSCRGMVMLRLRHPLPHQYPAQVWVPGGGLIVLRLKTQLRNSSWPIRGHYNKKPRPNLSDLGFFVTKCWCRERDSNPHIR
jgi:hypothetical protein